MHRLPYGTRSTHNLAAVMNCAPSDGARETGRSASLVENFEKWNKKLPRKVWKGLEAGKGWRTARFPTNFEVLRNECEQGGLFCWRGSHKTGRR